jgi:hypothetical protein
MSAGTPAPAQFDEGGPQVLEHQPETLRRADAVRERRGLFKRNNPPPQGEEALEIELLHEVAETVAGRDRDNSPDPRNVPQMPSPQTQKRHQCSAAAGLCPAFAFAPLQLGEPRGNACIFLSIFSKSSQVEMFSFPSAAIASFDFSPCPQCFPQLWTPIPYERGASPSPPSPVPRRTLLPFCNPFSSIAFLIMSATVITASLKVENKVPYSWYGISLYLL